MATMHAFANLSYQQQQNHELLSRLNDDILVLKLQAQGQSATNGLRPRDVQESREEIASFLAALEAQVRLITVPSDTDRLDVNLAGLATRFIRHNPHDVLDRSERLETLRSRLLDDHGHLRDRDFRMLDELQKLLEEETAEDMRGLYRL